MQKFLHSGTYPVFQQHFPQNQTHKKIFVRLFGYYPAFFSENPLKRVIFAYNHIPNPHEKKHFPVCSHIVGVCIHLTLHAASRCTEKELHKKDKPTPKRICGGNQTRSSRRRKDRRFGSHTETYRQQSQPYNLFP